MFRVDVRRGMMAAALFDAILRASGTPSQGRIERSRDRVTALTTNRFVVLVVRSAGVITLVSTMSACLSMYKPSSDSTLST